MNEKNNISNVWDYLVEMDIATQAELELVTGLNGYNIESLNDVLYYRTGYRDIEQLLETTDY